MPKDIISMQNNIEMVTSQTEDVFYGSHGINISHYCVNLKVLFCFNRNKHTTESTK